MRQAPVALLTGAPGSGKTALLDTALRSGALTRTAVVVNDTGAGGAGNATLPRSGGEVRILPGGCVCCEVRADLEIALLRLLRSAAHGEIPEFERVVIETGGLAEPGPLLELFAGSAALSAGFWLETVIAVVDAAHGDAALAEDGTPLRQALLADRLVLTKWEPVAAAALARIEARLAEINPHAECVRAARGTCDPLWFAAAQAQSFRIVPAEALRAAHDDSVQSFVLCWEEPQSLAAIGNWLHACADAHGPRLLRAKGIVATTGEAQAVAVHVVGHVVAAPAFLSRHAPSSRVVFIARGLEPGDVRPPWPVAAAIAQPAQSGDQYTSWCG